MSDYATYRSRSRDLFDVAGDSIPQSPATSRNSTFLAVHAFHERAFEPLARDVEAVFDRYDGRPHWGTHHTKTADELSNLYPKWDNFVAARGSLDPEGLFVNGHLERVLGRSR